MKNILYTIILSFLFSFSVFAEWTYITKNINGDTIYVDFDRIRKHDGYVYWWEMFDYLKPTELGVLSSKAYNQGDCKLFRVKYLSYSHHNEPMGGGTGDSNSPKNPEWKYPPPNSVNEFILKSVCSR